MTSDKTIKGGGGGLTGGAFGSSTGRTFKSTCNGIVPINSSSLTM